jgi:hypothetical protein
LSSKATSKALIHSSCAALSEINPILDRISQLLFQFAPILKKLDTLSKAMEVEAKKMRRVLTGILDMENTTRRCT